MTTPVQAFDQHMEGWKAWQSAPWGRLRYSLAHHTLLRHLAAPALQILDIGGGNGLDSLPFAELGHSVTIADYSVAMLTAAQQAAAERNIAERVQTIQADIASLVTSVPEASFDVVFCHNVLQYVDDAPNLLQAIGRLVRPHGLLSIISPNPDSEAYRLALAEQKLPEAYAQLKPSTAVANMFGVAVRRYTAQQLQEWMQSANCPMIEQSGILCVCGYIADNEPKYDSVFYSELERLEQAMSQTYPYYLLARLLHLIGRKRV